MQYVTPPDGVPAHYRDDRLRTTAHLHLQIEHARRPDGTAYNGDDVVLVKDLKVKGSSLTLKQGTKVRNLRVVGEKWVTLNQGEEFIRLAGVIRPIDIAPDNSLPSWKVADARITYSGKGALNDANAMGWLGRAFQSLLSPF